MKNLFYSIILICISGFIACSETTKQPEIPTVEPYKMKSGKMVNRFENAILNIEREDSTRTVVEDEILFIGSSSIRMWNSLHQDMLPLRVINRGFGGSTIPEVNYYINRIVLPYAPPLIVFYCGENDISEGYSPEEVAASFKAFDDFVHPRLPDTQILFISMKPSLDRWDLWDQFKEGNKLIKDYIDSKPHLHYFDSSAGLLTVEGTPDSTVFVEDGLHMNKNGYDQWTAELKPILIELMEISEPSPAK